MSKIDIAGLKIDALSKQELLSQLAARTRNKQKTFLTTPYSEFLHAALRDPGVMDLLNQADIAIPDGIGLFWAKRYLSIPLTAKSYLGKILQGLWQIKYTLAAIIFYPRWIKSALPEKISGADLIWDLAKLAADNNFSIYILGGYGDTPKITADKLISKYPNIKISGYSNKNPEDLTIIDDIKSAQPDLLFVAYGPITQEWWIAANIQNLPVKLAVGFGGTFDYLAGKQPQPPQLLRQAGLEWLWRLFTQPKRLKRIFNATFGLASKLWHYKVFSSLPLRPNVGIVILNQKGEILICQRDPKNFYVDIISNEAALKKQNYWQLPQGGIDGKENLIEAAKREAGEETGIKNLELIKVSKQTNTYIWNNALRKFWRNRRHRNIGQVQNIVYFKFSGGNSDIKVDQREFINYRWISPNELDKVVHPERISLTRIVQEDLKEMREKAII